MVYLWTQFLIILLSASLCADFSPESEGRGFIKEKKINHASEANFFMSDGTQEERMQVFEKEIAYFFGVDNEEPVKEAYIRALGKLQEIGLESVELLEKEMLPLLEAAYQSIAEQRNWVFDTRVAAELEFLIILGNYNGASFETIEDVLVKLYRLIFQIDSPLIQKAAKLRTFLYLYKSSLLLSETQFSDTDQRVMLEMASASKKFLNSIHSMSFKRG